MGRTEADETPALLYDLVALHAEPREVHLSPGVNVIGISRGGTTVFGVRQESLEPVVRPFHFDIASATQIPFEHAVSVSTPQSTDAGAQSRAGRTVVLASASQTRLVTSTAGSDLQVWRLDDPAAAPETLQVEQNIAFVKLAPDERRVLVGYSSQGGPFGRLLGRADRIHCLSLDGADDGWSEEISTGGGICDFSPDGGRLLLIETDESTRRPHLTVRSMVSGRLLQSMALPRVVGSAAGGRTSGFSRPSAIELRCDPDGRSVLLSTTDGVRQFEIPSWTMISATVPEPAEVTDFGFFRDGTAVYAFSEDHVRLHDLSSGATETIHGALLYGRISNDGGRLVGTHENADDSSRTQNVTLRIIDLAGGAAVQEHHLSNLSDGGGFATRPGTLPTSLSADRRHFMIAVADDEPVEPESVPENGRRPRRPASAFNVHDSLTGNVVTTLESRQQVGAWCLSPGTDWIALSTRINQVLPVVVLTNLRSGASFPLNPGRSGSPGGLDFSDDEHWLVCASGTQFAVFDLRDNEFDRILIDTGAPILDFALLPDNRTVLVLEADSVFSAWDIESGHSFSMTLDCTIPAREFAISPDGTRLATLHPHTSRSQVRVWEMPTATEGAPEQIEASVARRSGIRLDGRGVHELSLVELQAGGDLVQDVVQDGDWHQARAIDEVDTQNWKSALWHLEQWTQLEPGNPLPYAWIAHCQLESGQLDDCLPSLDLVRNLTRVSDTSHTALVPVLLEIELVNSVPNAEVLEHLEHQLQLDPTSLTSILRKSWIEANMRRWDEAIRNREYVVERVTDNHSIQFELAAWYRAAGQRQTALDAHIESMLDLWESTTQSDPAAAAALAALLGSQDSALLERAYAVADRAVEGNRGNSRNPAGFADLIMDRFDRDGDGKLSPAELGSAPFLTSFLGIEPDGEKNLTRDDLAEAYQQFLASREQGGSSFAPRRSTDISVLLAKGIADFRRGAWDAAHEFLSQANTALVASRDAEEATEDDAEPVENARIALSGLFLAMTENQRGNMEVAGEHMTGARTLLDGHVDDPTTYDSELEWWIFARDVLQEAEGAFSG